MNNDQFLEDIAIALHNGDISVDDITEAYNNHELSNYDIEAIEEISQYLVDKALFRRGGLASEAILRANGRNHTDKPDERHNEAQEEYNKYKILKKRADSKPNRDSGEKNHGFFKRLGASIDAIGQSNSLARNLNDYNHSLRWSGKNYNINK